MKPLNYTEAFNECVERLRQGQTLQDCLNAYPEYASSLKELLQVVIATRDNSNTLLQEAQEARERHRQRILATRPVVISSRSVFRWQSLVAVFALMMFFGGVLLWLNRDEEDVASEQIAPSPRLTPTMTSTATQTNVPSSTPTPTSTVTNIPTGTSTPTPTLTSTVTNTPTPTNTSTSTPTRRPTLTPSPTPTLLPPVDEEDPPINEDDFGEEDDDPPPYEDDGQDDD